MKSIAVSAQETLFIHTSLAHVFGHAHGYLRIEWQLVPMVSTDVRSLFAQILHLLQREQFHKLFTERTIAPPLSAADCRWMLCEWMPRAAREAGLTHFAVVESKEQVHARTTRSVSSSDCNTELQFRYFDSFAQAETWIREAA